MASGDYPVMNWTTYGMTGYTCGSCGQWVPWSGWHACPALANVTPVHPQAGWTCGGCGKYVHGFHGCPQVQTFGMAESAPEPEARPGSPLAALAADLRDLLGKAAGWLSERKL